MYICLCKGIREAEFELLVARHGSCPEAIKQAMGLDQSCCGRCEASLAEMIKQVSREEQAVHVTQRNSFAGEEGRIGS